MMKRTLFGCLLALCIGSVFGCGSGTETTVVDPQMTDAESSAQAEEYEQELETSQP